MDVSKIWTFTGLAVPYRRNLMGDSMTIKFKTIATSDNELYGLDEAGQVWVWNGSGEWCKMLMPAGPAIAEVGFI
jgi:hypothetical protein